MCLIQRGPLFEFSNFFSGREQVSRSLNGEDDVAQPVRCILDIVLCGQELDSIFHLRVAIAGLGAVCDASALAGSLPERVLNPAWINTCLNGWQLGHLLGLETDQLSGGQIGELVELVICPDHCPRLVNDNHPHSQGIQEGRKRRLIWEGRGHTSRSWHIPTKRTSARTGLDSAWEWS